MSDINEIKIKNVTYNIRDDEAYILPENGVPYTDLDTGVQTSLDKADTALQPIIEITWSALKDFRDNSQLVPGMQYRITDYICTTAMAYTQSAGHQFDIIVVADSENTLNENARAALHSGDTYFSNAGAKLESWELKYCLDNDTTRFAWAQVQIIESGGDEYYRDITLDTVHDNVQYYGWSSKNHMYRRVYTLTQSPSVGDVSYNNTFLEDSYITGVNNKGKGVIYWMKDEWNNECPYDFKNIQFARWEQTNPIGYVYDEDEEDYVQDSDQSWVPTYNLKAGFYSINGSSNDIMLFYDDDLEEYKKKISYTVSSIPTYCYTFGRGLDASLSKSVYGNVIKEYYSNKLQLNNIVFLETTLTQNCYSNTFCTNCRYNTFGNNCTYNTFGTDCTYNTFGTDCTYNTFDTDCGHNIFGNYCRYNTFGNNCNFNTFVNNCHYNTFDTGCSSNIFGNYFRHNIFGNYCKYNTFGNECQYNTFVNNCNYNTFDTDCSSNIFGTDCSYNIFGNRCKYNAFGNGCEHNIFGNYYYINTFGEMVIDFIFGSTTGATSSSQTKDYILNVIVENGVQYVNAYCTGTTSSYNYCQNIRICLGVQGTDNSNRKQIDITSNIGSTVNTVYQPANSQTISV